MLASELDPLDAIILSAFSRMGTIPGRKTLQKLVYFLKETGLDIDFRFQWDRFGPYSSELGYYVEDLVAERLVESETKEVPLSFEEGPGVQYNFHLSNKSRDLLSSIVISQTDKTRIDRVITLIREITPHNLELYASVHYVARFMSTRDEKTQFPDALVDLIEDYKPRRFSPQEIKTAYYNLRSKGWL